MQAEEFNLAQVCAAVAAANPDRDCIVFGDRRLTFAQTDERARRFARALHGWGLGARRERSELAAHESGQSHLGLYLANCNEFLEAMIGAYKARVAPFNVNYRYVADELVYLLDNAAADALVYHARFGPTLAQALQQAPERLAALRLIHVDDDSGSEPLPGAVRYEELLASVSDEPLDVTPSPDDLYVLYTGGTTGMPKGVLWRQHDIYMNTMGGRAYGTGEMVTSLDEIVDRSRPEGPATMTAAPLMHGAAQWAAFISICGGRSFVMAPTTTHFDPAELWALASRERAASLSIVGDAFGRPLGDALETSDLDLPGDLSGLLVLISGGAALSAPIKQRFVELLPHLTILDAGGSSESGSQMGQVSSRMHSASGRFAPNPGAVVVSADMTRILSPGDDEIGWLGQQGLIPLGYLGDPEKTARTFPVIEGIRHSIPGDRARWHADGEIELLGRDSVTINSGGEKIFAEEVEAAVAEHRAVYDVVVTGRPSTRWGNEVVALVQLVEGQQASQEELADSIIAEAARHIARYKLPKEVVFCSRLQRSPSGKADYRWAQAHVARQL